MAILKKLLLGLVVLAVVLDRITHGFAGLAERRPAVSADHPAVVGKCLKVASDGHPADAQFLGELFDGALAAPCDEFSNVGLSGGLVHVWEIAPRWFARCGAWSRP